MDFLETLSGLIINEGMNSYKNNSFDLKKSAKRVTKQMVRNVVSESESLQGIALNALYAEKVIDDCKNTYGKTVKEKKLKNCARYGNVIYVCRKGGIYKHFGIYINDNYIIHFSDTGNDFGRDVCIRKIDLKGFLDKEQDYYVCVYPKTSNIPKYHLYSPKETVERAKSLMGKIGYNLITNNCEHFATWCKTGISESAQVNNVISLSRLLKCSIDIIGNY